MLLKAIFKLKLCADIRTFRFKSRRRAMKLEILRTKEFDHWLSKLPPKVRVIVEARLD